ncbi:hypothetical protein SAMN05421788_10563 [Filimonas lacunae]|uniref:Uncharacterized protein n=1 Tax=Filimonas lacunae TaxID=477680 RepID=A0A173MD47_9BACT|nr:hypothetical protein [Filimonas lacunae]BAV05485.1 hypothetical protein FLA_1492 [Filimonas lacunae]SIT20791.1 hypothetical protein SAMN05421788_10563 [Filimonas lacunae]
MKFYNQLLTLLQRIKAPTPSFFKKLRAIGLTLMAVSAVIIAATDVLPHIVIQIAKYLAVAGGVLSAVSQTTVDNAVLQAAKQLDE